MVGDGERKGLWRGRERNILLGDEIPKIVDDFVAYALEVLNDELKDQRHLLKHENGEEHQKEIEQRIEQLKRGIKYLKEYKEETWGKLGK